MPEDLKIEYHKIFLKQFDKLRPEIQESFYKRLALFKQDKFHPLLDNHKLSGRYSGKRSINITGDFRALFEEEVGAIIFKLIGTHHELYGK